MSPDEIASMHPVLYHITRGSVVPSIKQHGLLSTSSLLDLFQVPPDQRRVLEERARPSSVTIAHPAYGKITLTDNAPLREAALNQCLDDGLTSADWMRLLNQRVFFWVNERDVDRHLQAGLKDGQARVVLKLDTLSVARAYLNRIELSAINTGATLRRPARRGLTTFAPAHLYTYREWRQLRTGRDRIKEFTVLGGIGDVADHLRQGYAL